jgi:hypothetical protein
MSLPFFHINNYNAPESLFMDTFTGGTEAWSLRKEKSSYSGSAIRVRRSYDNTELDIGFVGNLIDKNALNRFCAENQLYYSRQYDQSNWTKSAGSVTANATTDPLGGSNGQRLYHGSAININQVVSTVANRKYYFPTFLKKSGSVNNCDLYIYRVGTGFVTQATFNLNTGTVVSEPYGSGATIVDAGGGWWLCTINGTHAGTTTSVGIYNSTEVYAYGSSFTSYVARDYVETTTSIIPAGHLYVRTWYGQLGAYNLEQATSADQPRIIIDGVLQEENNVPVVRFSGSPQKMTNSSVTLSQPNTIILVAKNNSGSTSVNAIDGITDRQAIYSDGSGNASYYASTTQSGSTTWGTTLVRKVIALFNGSSSKLRMDGTDISTGNPGATGLTGISVGTFSGSHWNGIIAAIHLYDSDKTSDFSAMDTNMNAYYG